MSDPGLATVAEIAAIVLVVVAVLKQHLYLHGRVTVIIAGVLAVGLSLAGTICVAGDTSAAGIATAVGRGLVAWGVAHGVAWQVREPPKIA